MINPDNVADYAKQKEDENYRFRIFLKNNADPKKLDEQFLELHRELFPSYDCSQCRNCCKEYHGTIPEEDISKDAALLGMEDDKFVDKYLKYNQSERYYETIHCPCDFLDENTGDCILAECKPENCRKYPYTDQPDRWGSLYGIIDSAGVCPVVYEMLERLKREYHFGPRADRRVYPNDPCPCGSGKKYKQCCGRYR